MRVSHFSSSTAFDYTWYIPRTTLAPTVPVYSQINEAPALIYEVGATFCTDNSEWKGSAKFRRYMSDITLLSGQWHTALTLL